MPSGPALDVLAGCVDRGDWCGGTGHGGFQAVRQVQCSHRCGANNARVVSLMSNLTSCAPREGWNAADDGNAAAVRWYHADASCSADSTTASAAPCAPLLVYSSHRDVNYHQVEKELVTTVHGMSLQVLVVALVIDDLRSGMHLVPTGVT